MRVVFVQYGHGGCGLAQMMVHSCKALGYEVWQISDMTAPEIPGVDSISRAEMNCGRMLFRARELAPLKAPYALLDTDMLVVRDIEEGFGGDVSLTWRAKHMVVTKDEPAPLRMPYNGGVVFVQSQEFMQDCYDRMTKMEPKRQDWYGDQIALRDAAESGKYKVKELRDETWNFCPDSENHDIPKVRIYHFKGLRKQFMPAAFQKRYL